MKKTHGLGGKEKLYSVWSNMRNRCNNPHCNDYQYYGGKGVRVCKEWDDYAAFREWSYTNGYIENAGLSIDRKDVNGAYSPENCRWATKTEQMNNMSSNRSITYNGETHTIAEWSAITGIPFEIIESRIVAYGWTYERALTTPVNSHRKQYEYLEEKHTLTEWAKLYGLNYHTLYNRVNIYSWSLAQALRISPKAGGHYE